MTEREDLGVLLALAYVAFVDDLKAHLHRYDGFGPWTGAVLRAVADQPLSLRRLAERLEMTSAGALKIVDAMVADGYLERVPDPTDGRVRAIAATPRGRKLLASARAFHNRFEDSLRAELGDRAVNAARRTLEAIVATNPRPVPPVFRPPRRRGSEVAHT